MAAVIALIDDAQLKGLASEDSYSEGVKLATAEVVDLTEVTPLKVKAQVKDHASQSYVEVKLISAMGRLIYTCTCDQTGFCPHCVATAIATSKHAAHKRSDESAPDSSI